MVGCVEMSTNAFVDEIGTQESGVARIADDCESEWVHYSRRKSAEKDTLKLRRFTGQSVLETVYDLAANDSDEEELPQIDDWHKLDVMRRKLEPQGLEKKFPLKVNDDVLNWSEVLFKLNSGKFDLSRQDESYAEQHEITEDNTNTKQIVIPSTRLRKYYKAMKLTERPLDEYWSQYYCENIQNLIGHWNKSYEVFCEYNNVAAGWGQGEQRELPEPPESLQGLKGKKATDQFTNYLIQNESVQTNIRFSYVSREISPRRARQAVFTDGRSGARSGRGGMDLLLKSETGLPVVGEVKVYDDKTAFFALIQAMTYAVELSTPNQLKRLKKRTHQFNDLDLKIATVEIAIILVNPYLKSFRENTLTNVKSIIKKLNNKIRDKKVCKGLSKITLLIHEGVEWDSFD